MWKRVLLGAFGLVLLLVTVAVIWIGPRFIIGILTYGRQAREGSLKVGDPAPIVRLIDRAEQAPRPLSEWIGGKPLVLVFGSFT